MIPPQFLIDIYLNMFKIHYCGTQLCNMLQIEVVHLSKVVCEDQKQHIVTTILWEELQSSSENIHSKGQLQQTFHCHPLENACDLSILNILIPKIKVYCISLPNLFKLYKNLYTASSFPRLSNVICIHFVQYICKEFRSQS
jgi:hypothetical protein